MSGQAPGGGPRPGTPWLALVAFALTVAGAAGFAIGYAMDLGTEVLGATMGAAFTFLAVGLGAWSSSIDAGEPEYVEEREVGPSSPEEYAGFKAALTEQPVPRTRVLWGMLGVAAASIGGAALFPLHSMFRTAPGVAGKEHVQGDLDEILAHTPWVAGRALVTETGARIKPDDLSTHSVMTAFPEGADPKYDVDAATLLLRVEPTELRLPPERADWTVLGVVAYSKLCTHAGCPVGLYADEPRQLLCPCHHSLFDVLTGATPIEGPAARPLPQLPLGLNEDGDLIAQGDFSAPVAAGWWGYPT